MRAFVASATLLTIAACSRPERPDSRITPLVPRAATRAQDAGPRPLAPAPLPHARFIFRPTVPTADLVALGAALERRARALDASDAHATVRADNTVALDVSVPMAAMLNLVADQLQRRGVLSIAAFDPSCDPFRDLRLPPNVVRVYTRVPWIRAPFFLLYARANRNTGVAPLAPFRQFVTSTAPPPGHVVLIGSVRDNAGDVGRRTFCVAMQGALFAPRVIESESTLDAANLYPLLRIHLGPTDAARLQQLKVSSPGGLVVAMDDEAIGLTDGISPRGDDWVQVQPEAPIPSVSPEMVGALLQGGPLPVPVEMIARE